MVADLVFIWDERMEAVDRHEFFGDRVCSRVVGLTAAHDAEKTLQRVDPEPLRPLRQSTVPVRMHGALDHRVRKNSRGPFDSVDLCHQGSVDQASGEKQPLVIP